MNARQESLAEITNSAITVLCREIGIANTARFLGQYSLGLGDYTKERHELLSDATVDEIVAEIKQLRKKPRKAKSPQQRAKRRVNR